MDLRKSILISLFFILFHLLLISKNRSSFFTSKGNSFNKCLKRRRNPIQIVWRFTIAAASSSFHLWHLFHGVLHFCKAASEEKESSTDGAHEEDDVANYNLIAKGRPDLFLWCSTKSRDEGWKLSISCFCLISKRSATFKSVNKWFFFFVNVFY